MRAVPDRTEAADYYFTYIDQVPDGDILELLDTQGKDLLDLLSGVSEKKSLFRYAPEKWSIRDVVNHVCDGERLFAFRAFWFARAHESSLPSFDQTIAASAARADDRPWRDHIEEFRAVRAASRALFRSLPAEAWTRRGIASDSPFSVRALAYITVGHAAHHARILRERYLIA